MEEKSLKDRIHSALDTIRPWLQADGGDVEVVEITPDQVVRIKLHGSCESCSMSSMTMKAGIEKTIKREFPEIKAVEAVTVPSETLS